MVSFDGLVFWASRPTNTQRNDAVGVPLWRLYKGDMVALPDHDHWVLCLFEKQKQAVYSTLERGLLSEPVERQREAFYKAAEAFIAAGAAPPYDGAGLTDAQLADRYERFFAVYEHYFPFIMCPFAVEDRLDATLKEKLALFDPDHALKYYHAITSPTELVDMQRMRIELIDLVLTAKMDDAHIAGMVERYHWMNEYGWLETLCDAAYFERICSEITPETGLREKTDTLEAIARNRRAFERLLPKLPAELRQLATTVNMWVVYRTHRMAVFQQALAPFRYFFRQLTARLNRHGEGTWAYPESLHLSYEEIIDFLRKGTVPDHAKVKLRVNGGALQYRIKGKEDFIYDTATIKKVLQQIHGHDTEVKGSVANPGKVKGEVALLMAKSDMQAKDFKGKVLVTRTTFPDFVPVMRQAVAFVTDEGGITSHAAIVSREFGVPCIVGTKNATRVLKDGDLVEVDADKGVVNKVG